MASNIYSELFEQLPIPERLEPENIAKMLDEHMEAGSKRSAIAVSSSSDDSRKLSGTKSHSAAYRAILSAAACAALVLGLMRFSQSESPVVTQDDFSADYASDYTDIHKTFQKYYVDDQNKTTLDSAIAEIEHSYNESEANQSTDKVEKDDIDNTPEQETPAVSETPNVGNETPIIEDPADNEEENVADEHEDAIRLPNIDGYATDHGIIADGGYMIVRAGNALRVLNTVSGLDYIAYIDPVSEVGESKTLVDFYLVGDKLAAVYSVETSELSDGEAPDADEDQSWLDTFIDGEQEYHENTVIKRSVEIAVYRLTGEDATLVYTQQQSGEYLDSSLDGGSIYVITDYNDYRLSPIVGVDDLESYVPTYTVNGERRYIEASNILIPSRITTTDYTVISGLNLALDDFNISIQALLGFEGRIVVTDGAVYIFGYETGSENNGTSVEIFSLRDGNVLHDGYTVLNGLALSGDGIIACNGAILVTTVSNGEAGYVTTVCAYDSTLSILSKVDLPALLTNVNLDGSRLYLDGSDASYAIDYSSPYAPSIIDGNGQMDIASRLVKFEDGYLTLVDDNGTLKLSKVIEDVNGELSQCCEVVVYSGRYVSKALDNNDVMYIGNGFVGIPYGYFDGLDYCYTYVVYSSTSNGFELVGSFEAHETDTAFEFGKAIEYNSSLYLTSEGRVYELVVSQDAVAYVGRADLIYSTYSGHA